MNKILSLIAFVLMANYHTHSQINFPAGTFERSGSNGGNGWITAYPESDSTALLYIELTRGAPSYNSGSIYTRINLTSSEIILRRVDIDLKCEIGLLIKKDLVVLNTLNNDCGFGHGVVSDGTFKKISSKTPQYFTNGEGLKVNFTKTSPEKYAER
ncbi:MAG: hypothetical protein ACJA2S_002182 [Cyclobacteriaceae bacterium]|jgi:hypothetical protein